MIDKIKELCKQSYNQGRIDALKTIRETLFLLKATGNECLIINHIDKKIKDFESEVIDE